MSHPSLGSAFEPRDENVGLTRCALLDEFWEVLHREPTTNPRGWLSDRSLEDRTALPDLEIIHQLHEHERSTCECGTAAAIPLFSSSHTSRGKESGAADAPQHGVKPRTLVGYPERIGKYLVIEPLGEGAQGQVYRVLHPELGRECVLKLARRPIEIDPAGQERLRNEGRLLAKCEHPNIVRVIDFDLNQGRPFLVMEYVHGQTLRRYAERNRPGPRRAAWIVARLAEAVASIRAQEIVHQDIKPSNVLIDDKGQPKLIDFGLAGLTHAWSEDTSRLVGGTISYMSPEQAFGRHEHIGPWTDVFGLGGVLYYLLTGRPVYQSSSEYGVLWQARKGQKISPRLINPRVPRALECICMKALESDPNRRFPTADDLKRVLRGFLARRWIAATGSAVVPMMGLAILAMHRPSSHPHATASSPVVLPALDTPRSAVPRILSFEVRLSRGDDPVMLGAVSLHPGPIFFGDDVRVQAQLDAPAYCYLIALNPDGTVQSCLTPEAAVPTLQTEDIRYPTSEFGFFRLSDGVGLQAFILLASREQLPPFKAWDGRAGLTWKPAETARSSARVWRYDGRWFEPVSSATRGEREKQSVVPAPFEEVCKYLRSVPGIGAIKAIAFSVVKPSQ